VILLGRQTANTTELSSGQSFSTVKIPLIAPSNCRSYHATATTLSWDAVTGAVSYEIYNGTTLVAATTSSSFTINNLIADTDIILPYWLWMLMTMHLQQVLMFRKTLSNSTQ
jgi:hypothetical protein